MKKIKSLVSKYYALALDLAEIDTLTAIKNKRFGEYASSTNADTPSHLEKLIGEFQGKRLDYHLTSLENTEEYAKTQAIYESNPILLSRLKNKQNSESILMWLMEKPVESLAIGFLSTEVIEEDIKPGDYILGCTYNFATAFTSILNQYGSTEDFMELYKKARKLQADVMSDPRNHGKNIADIYNVNDEYKISNNVFAVVHAMLKEINELKAILNEKKISELIKANILEFHRVPITK